MWAVKTNVIRIGDRCCGCGSCVAACPKGCISLVERADGFKFPIIKPEKCVGCGHCERACPVLTNDDEDCAIAAYWAVSKESSHLTSSSSGGVFGLLAKQCLEGGGVVYGAAFSDDFRSVKHVRVDSTDCIDTVMRSKYVQSDIDTSIFWSLAEDLRSGCQVVFSGTACQISAIRNFLRTRNIPMRTLLCVDVVCHGVPSPGLWRKWIDHVELSHASSLSDVNFRKKNPSWNEFSVSYSFKDGASMLVGHSEDWYMRSFLMNAALRSSCLNCPSKRRSGSDITLCDYWGIEKQHADVPTKYGVSGVIVNTEKGLEAFSQASSGLYAGKTTYEQVFSGNPSLERSSGPYYKRDKFMSQLSNGRDIGWLVRKWSFTIPRWRMTARKVKAALIRS